MYKEIEQVGEFEYMIEDDFTLTIHDKSDEDSTLATVRVKLESQDEANKAIEELNDETGDTMHENGAIFSKYSELHKFRP